MYFLDLDDERIGDFKQGWGEIGDSIVVVGGDGLWNCHVHTNDIGAAIEVALDLGGRPQQIRVTDLFEEVADEHADREAAMTGAPSVAAAVTGGLPPVTSAVVAVGSGDGLVELFGQLGVQGVVTGGQTLNPSTAELLAAVEAVNADQVVVLPNNKNIIPVAEQVDALTVQAGRRRADHGRCPRRSPRSSSTTRRPTPTTNAAEMAEAAAAVATGEVTQAVRDTASDVGPDRRPATGSASSAATASWRSAARSTARRGAARPASSTPGREIVTIIDGRRAPRRVHRRRSQAWLDEQRPDVEVEVHHGGQPLYPYLFGVE